jgi:hypothetical protein
MSAAKARTSVRVGVGAGLALGVLGSGFFAYANLGPSSRSPTSDDAVAVLLGYVVVALVFVVFGFVCRARRMSMRECAIAGALSGLVALWIVAAAITVIDNVWLSTVARQPDKLDGLAHSNMFHTMRAYLNGQIALGLVILPPNVAAGCALLTAAGAKLRRPPPRGSGSVARRLA